MSTGQAETSTRFCERRSGACAALYVSKNEQLKAKLQHAFHGKTLCPILTMQEFSVTGKLIWQGRTPLDP